MSQQVVIVTGASGGLGGEIAVQFAATGAQVVVNYNMSPEWAQEVVQKICSSGGEAFSYKADVRNYQQVKSMVEETLNRWGRIDILVNNAGAHPKELGYEEGRAKGRLRLITEMEEGEWDAYVDTNLKGAFICIKAVAPHMIVQSEGHIINIASIHGVIGREYSAHYSAAKAGLINLTKVAARELGEYNIRVNTVLPGMIPHSKVKSSLSPEAAAGGSYRPTVLKRGAQNLEEVGRFVVFLSTMQKVSGQLFNLDSVIV